MSNDVAAAAGVHARFLGQLIRRGDLSAWPSRKLLAAIGAVAFISLRSGAELDITTYIVARRFGPERFGAIYAAFMEIVSVSASIKRVIAGAVFDTSHSYVVGLTIIAPMVIAAAAIVAWIPISTEDVAQRCPGA
jgi:hypothetical protein